MQEVDQASLVKTHVDYWSPQQKNPRPWRPLASLPARGASRPEGRAYASERRGFTLLNLA